MPARAEHLKTRRGSHALFPNSWALYQQSRGHAELSPSTWVHQDVQKNLAGCKLVRGTEVAAVLYTLLESAKLVCVEPRDNLRAAAENALTGKLALLPHGYREQLRAAR